MVVIILSVFLLMMATSSMATSSIQPSSDIIIQWSGPFVFLKNKENQKYFSEYNTTTIKDLISQFPSVNKGERFTSIKYIPPGRKMYTSSYSRELRNIFDLLTKEISTYTEDEIYEILILMERQSFPAPPPISSGEEDDDDDSGSDSAPHPKIVKTEKVYTTKEATRISQKLYELFLRYNLLRQRNYSNDCSKFFIKSVCSMAIAGMPTLCVDISTTNHSNQLIHLSINGEYILNGIRKHVKVHGVPDVAITDVKNKRLKYLIGVGKSTDDPGSCDQKGVGQLLLATLVSLLEENNPILGFLLTPEKIVLYKLCDDAENIKIQIIYDEANTNCLEDFIPVIGLIREEIKGRTTFVE